VKPTRLTAVAARATEALTVWNFMEYFLSKNKDNS
jgi:hypothetical protein